YDFLAVFQQVNVALPLTAEILKHGRFGNVCGYRNIIDRGFFIVKLADALERGIENGQALFFGQGTESVQLVCWLFHSTRFCYVEYSTNNRNGQVFWSMIQKFSFYTVRPTKISLESTGVFKSAVARKCNSFKYYYLKYKITLGDVYEI